MQRICTDKVVGEILSGWRYDISGLAREMRADYERHFAECERCRFKQRLHRFIDFSLIVVASVSAVVFLVAFFAVRHYNPQYAIYMQFGAGLGFGISALIWIIVAVSTPVPKVVAGLALEQARRIHERLPEPVKSRIPDKVTDKLTEP